MLSEDNRVRIEPVSPTRGIIFDRQGEILAQNLPVFSLEVIPEVVDDMDAMIASLRRIIDIGGRGSACIPSGHEECEALRERAFAP